MRCSSPAAYPHLSSNQQDEIQNDLTSFVHSIYSSNSSSSSSSNSKSATTTTANASSRRSFSFFEEVESELVILPGRKAWTLYLDAVVLSDAGNLYDVLFLACRGALWDTRVPRTRAVEYQQQQQRQPNRGGGRGQSGMGGGDEEEDMWKEAIRTRVQSRAADFELEDTSEAGKRLSGREKCPVAVTLNILPTRHVLDATYAEEQAVPLKLVLLYSFTSHEDGEEARFLGMRLIGPGQVPLGYLKELLRQGQGYAKQLVLAMDAQLVAQEEGSRD
ncbi:hypothetical protein FRC14_001668 [Serendipita sp. 396]|nr:hypothetical protein FRC14_001668 [Serendipita sp. 396]KAG8767771.1 hypothetical protein FRC15_005481 [Serendipita sp. 397]